MYMVAALSLNRSTAAIGAWSGSRGFIASAHAALLPPAIKEPITSNAIRIFMMPFPRRRRAHLKRLQRLELATSLGAFRCKGLVGGAQSLPDIVLQICVQERSRPRKPREVLLRDPQHDGIFERHHQPSARR